MTKYDLIIIGGGPAGLSAAKSAYKNGVSKILILERLDELGGILQQCIHNGFGLHKFKEELTGPEYAQRYIDEIKNLGIEYKINSTVLNVEVKNGNRYVQFINPEDGYLEFETKAVILAMGCYERTRGGISIPGDRPSGIFTAGTAQKFINMDGYMVGKKVLILGSGDIGLIMARRLTLEGAKVEAVVELMPYSGGLNRNIVQCLEDYNIPLLLSHTVIDIQGDNRVEKVIVSKVDENKKPIKGTEIEYDVDTLLLSVGLVPDTTVIEDEEIEIDKKTKGPTVNEMMQTTQEGIFACGNVLHVHDLVDYVSEEAEKAGYFASKYILESKQGNHEKEQIINANNGISYVVPQKVDLENLEKNLEIFFRVRNVYSNVEIVIKNNDRELMKIKKKHVAPGEMEKIIVPKDFLNGTIGTIDVELVEGQ